MIRKINMQKNSKEAECENPRYSASEKGFEGFAPTRKKPQTQFMYKRQYNIILKLNQNGKRR